MNENTYSEARGEAIGCPTMSLLYFLETGFLAEAGAGLSPARDPPVSDPTAIEHRGTCSHMQLFYVGARGSNSGPHAVTIGSKHSYM